VEGRRRGLMKPTSIQQLLDLDRAFILWSKDDRADWEWLESIRIFKTYGYWLDTTQEPDLHALKHMIERRLP